MLAHVLNDCNRGIAVVDLVLDLVRGVRWINSGRWAVDHDASNASHVPLRCVESPDRDRRESLATKGNEARRGSLHITEVIRVRPIRPILGRESAGSERSPRSTLKAILSLCRRQVARNISWIVIDFSAAIPESA